MGRDGDRACRAARGGRRRSRGPGRKRGRRRRRRAARVLRDAPRRVQDSARIRVRRAPAAHADGQTTEVSAARARRRVTPRRRRIGLPRPPRAKRRMPHRRTAQRKAGKPGIRQRIAQPRKNKTPVPPPRTRGSPMPASTSKRAANAAIRRARHALRRLLAADALQGLPFALLDLVHRDAAVPQVALRVIRDVRRRHARHVGLREQRQILRRVRRVRLLHRAEHRHRAVVRIRRVRLHVFAEALLVLVRVRLAAGHFGERQAGERSDRAFGRVARDLQEGRRVHHLAAHQRRRDAERLHLLGHRRGLRIRAAVVDEVRLRRLELRQDRLEVDSLVVREFTIDDRRARRLRRLLELVGKALAVSGAIVDDRDLLHAEILHRERARDRALLRVGRHHPEGRLVALRRVLGRRRHRDLRDARVRVDARSRNRRARVEVAEHALDAVVDELLRDRRAGARVGLIVLRVEHELHRLAADRRLRRVDVLDREHDPVLHILAVVRLRARHRRGKADLDVIRVRRPRERHDRDERRACQLFHRVLHIFS
ncbi:hypothetical protein BURPS1710b_0164 [Burkholderia pseudomallei 1710b]|uniref:Uncharacterized protein n=1 Tax=Burkholderia pseudomallei (strain 1710b) TaxID=320372 RepID=Q3JXX3_BURP1|nr:hypothetical protein BURPS1710b_0164 [Burkholderia pseudomallei 1710b]